MMKIEVKVDTDYLFELIADARDFALRGLYDDRRRKRRFWIERAIDLLTEALFLFEFEYSDDEQD